MSQTIKILGVLGSLRRNSYNRSLLLAAQRLLPEEAEMRIFTLDGIPPFNQDEETQPPPEVVEFKSSIRACDALLIATPEYNYSIPGVLKNAIDWATRPYGDNPFLGKPAALMGASPGSMGTSRSQYHLRQVMTSVNAITMTHPELFVSNAADRIDENGKITDPKIEAQLGKLIRALIEWTRKWQANK